MPDARDIAMQAEKMRREAFEHGRLAGRSEVGGPQLAMLLLSCQADALEAVRSRFGSDQGKALAAVNEAVGILRDAAADLQAEVECPPPPEESEPELVAAGSGAKSQRKRRT